MSRYTKRDQWKRESPVDAEAVNSELELSVGNAKKLLKHSSDVKFRELYINGQKDLPATMVFIDGLVDSKALNDILLSLVWNFSQDSLCISELIEELEQGALHHASQKIHYSLSNCVHDIIDGSVAFIIDEAKAAATFNIKGPVERSITEPTGENVIKGAKDSFVENLRINTATIRTRMKTNKLVIEEMIIGKQTETRVCIVYIKGITNTHIVQELRRRLNDINTDAVLTTGVIEEAIADKKFSTFPQAITTVRPDKFCSSMVEGRVGILIDGLPVSVVIPGTFVAFLQAPEDYSQNFIISSLIRGLRYILVFVTLFLPGFYIAVSSFHIEMIPTELALVITASKEGVPFYSFVEVIFMLLAFEVIVEAGVRLPKSIGQAVSVVGAVVVGQAAVEAKLVSPTVVVTIAVTAISSFAIPDQDFSNALRLWRLIFAIVSSVIGLFGLSIGVIILLHHLSNIEVFGVPYLSPFVGEENKQMQDSFFRLPFFMQYKRPISLRTKNKKRRGKA